MCYNAKVMLNRLRQHNRLTPLVLLRVFAVLCLITPWFLVGASLVIRMGHGHLAGGPVPGMDEPLLANVVLASGFMWAGVFFLAVLIYGLTPQLIAHIKRCPLAAPLAVLAARLGRWLQRAVANLTPLPATASKRSKSSRSCRPTPRVRPPPVALLSGITPLLE